ncbi:MAG: type II secretion system F family protein [Bryobacterales bacterium]|nr:type II secretion system F family protein [Bryobacteraceae bacterium]MDW8353565.1 type II secretion system F family protein [Bryobacterales bacterium]
MGTVLAAAVASWACALLCWWVLTRLWRKSELKRFQSRLGGRPSRRRSKKSEEAPALLTAEDHETGRLVRRALERFRLDSRLALLLEQADLRWHVARLIHASLALALCGFGAVWYLAPAWRMLALPVAVAGGSLPLVYVMRRRRRRLRRFEEQFPESLDFLARSLRAGHAFSVSLEMLYKEFQDPLATEFRRTFEEHNLGLPLETALEKLAKRVPLMDVQFLVSAVLLQKRTGGNLAELLDKLAYVIRERFKLRGRIRAVSAHGRMTGYALSAIPVMVGLMMFLVNREWVTFFFTDETGRMMLGLALGLQVLGYAVIKKIVSIEV